MWVEALRASLTFVGWEQVFECVHALPGPHADRRGAAADGHGAELSRASRVSGAWASLVNTSTYSTPRVRVLQVYGFLGAVSCVR